MKSMKEIWKVVNGFPNYEISNFSNVKSLSRTVNCMGGKRTTKEKILKQRLTKLGYKSVTLYNNEKVKIYFVHVLVANAFIENKENKPFVNHKNGIKTDNNIENLEWVTSKENNNHGFKMGLIVAPKGEKHYAAKKILCLKNNKIYITIKNAAKAEGLSVSALKSRLLRNHHTFKYV